MKKNLLILTEAGDGIGFGHITRCSTLHRNASEAGIQSKIIAKVQGDYTFGNIQKLNWEEEFEQIPKGYSNVLIDSYLASSSTFKKLVDHFDTTIAIDDYDRIPYECDVIINPNPYGDKIPYDVPLVISGPETVILRKEFCEETRRFFVNKNIKNIFITLGGSDVRKLLPRFIRTFKNTAYNVVIGTGNDDYSHFLNHVDDCILKGMLSAQQMIEEYLSADLVISGCGQTLHELACLGIPTIGICIDYDQRLNQRFYLSKSILTIENHWSDHDLEDNILDEMETLKDVSKREMLSEISKNMIDGDGGKRIIKKLFQKLSIEK